MTQETQPVACRCGYGARTFAYPKGTAVFCSETTHCRAQTPTLPSKAKAIAAWNAMQGAAPVAAPPQWLSMGSGTNEGPPTNGTVFLGFDAYDEFQIARMDEGRFRSSETGKRVDLDYWSPLRRPGEAVPPPAPSATPTELAKARAAALEEAVEACLDVQAHESLRCIAGASRCLDAIRALVALPSVSD